MPCTMVMDLSRLGLFLLGTAPGITATTYFSALWNRGDLKVFLQTDILTVPSLLILEFLGEMVVPVFIDIGLAGICPGVKGDLSLLWGCSSI